MRVSRLGAGRAITPSRFRRRRWRRSGSWISSGLRAYHYQRFRLKTLHAIAEGVTTRLAGRQEMLAPQCYRSGAYHKPTLVPFQVSRSSQPLPSQDSDVLVSGPDGALDVDPRDFPDADFSDCDDEQELSFGSLGDASRGSAQVRQGSTLVGLYWINKGR